jgi:hypothetical protein
MVELISVILSLGDGLIVLYPFIFGDNLIYRDRVWISSDVLG